MNHDDLENLWDKLRKRPVRASLFLLAAVLVTLCAIWIAAYLTQKASTFASRQRSESELFETRIDDHSVLMDGMGDTYSSAVHVRGARDGHALGEAIRNWLVSKHPGFTYDSAAIPVTQDGRTYLSLHIYVGGNTNIAKDLYFDITETFDIDAVTRQEDYHKGLLSVLDGVALGIKGALGRTGLATRDGPAVFDHSYVEHSTRQHSDPRFQSETADLLQSGFQRSEETRVFRDPLTGIALGRQLGELNRIHIGEFGPGGGYSCEFVSTNSLWLTVYFYDANRRGIPNDVDGNVVEHEFVRAKEQALFRYSNRDQYAEVIVPEPDRVTIGKGDNSLEFLRHHFRFEHTEHTNTQTGVVIQPVPGWSVLLFRGIGDAFVKVRASYPEERSSICQNELLGALDELAAHLSKRAR